MRPYDSDYGELDELDDFGYPDVRAIRHMVNERQQDELRFRARRRNRSHAKNRWLDDEWSDYDDYDDNDFDDYDVDEFDASAELIIDHH